METKIKRQRVVLDICYSAPQDVCEPALWQWADLLDLGALDSCCVVAATEVLDEPNGGAPHFDQKDAPLLLGTVGTMQRVVGTDNEYTLHGTAAYVNLTQGQNACVFISQAEGGVVVQLLDTSAPPIMEVYREFEVERHEFIDNEDNDNG